MKKMLFWLIAVVVLTGCGSKDSTDKLPVLDLTTPNFASDRVEISDEIKSIEYVPLELTDESLIAEILDLAVSDDYVFIYSTRQDGILQFDRKGHFVRSVAKTGNGPGETAQIVSLSVDDENRLLCVSEFFSTSFYSFDGEFIKKVNTLRPYLWQYCIGPNTMAEMGRESIPMDTPGIFSLGVFNLATDDTVAIRQTVGNMDLLPLKETLLGEWSFNGGTGGMLCYSAGIDTVWNLGMNGIHPAFRIDFGFSADEQKMVRSEPGAIVDGKYWISRFFETPRRYIIKCFEADNQSQFHLFSLDKETGAVCHEKSSIDAMELFKYNRILTGIGIHNETDGGLPVWPYYSYPGKKLMVQLNTAVEIEYLKEKYPELKQHPVLQKITEDSNPLVTIYHLR